MTKRTICVDVMANRLLSLGLLGLSGLVAGCYAADDRAAEDDVDSAAGASVLPAGSQFHDLYMVAHEDDDLLFMNPDVRESIRAGHRVRTVYLTAGDAGERSAYWKDGREAGIREAYALMAGVPNRWTPSTDTVGGKPVYRFTLDANPLVSLVFLRLPDGGTNTGFASPSGDTDCNRPGYKSLYNLWNDTTGAYTVPVLGTWGSCSGTTYTKSELEAVLRSLVQRFAPTRMHIQDLSDLYGGDHSDHVHAAKFAFDAHHAYAPEHQLVVHRDYNIENEEENLAAPQKQDKTDVFCTYAAHDPHIRDCSTYGNDASPGAWFGRQYSSAQVTYADGWLAGLEDKCLDLPDANTTNGTALQIWDCADVPEQKWTLSGGKIKLSGTNKCVDLRGADVTNGTPLQIWDCADVSHQKWTLTSDGALRGLHGKCVGVGGMGAANGTSVQIGDCVSQAASGGGREIVPRQDWTVRFGVVTGWTSGGGFSDAEASGRYGSDPSYYGSVRLGDVNGDRRADVCGRRPDGVYCALNQGNGSFGVAVRYTTEFSDAYGWAAEMHGMTLMLGDVDRDGRADVCARGGAGILCATANASGTAFEPGGSGVWTTSFSNATEFASGAQYYGSLRLVDVNGDGYADVCGRGASGIQCALNNRARGFSPATTWLGTEYLDAFGWSAERYGMTIAFGDIDGDGRADVCGRGAARIVCATGKAGGGFENPRRWSLRQDFADSGTSAGWDSSRAYYGSIRLGDVNGDGYADVCGRGATGLVCGLSSGNAFDHLRRILPQDYTSALGWSYDGHGMTLSLADLDGDGALDVCGRGSAAVLCSLARW